MDISEQPLKPAGIPTPTRRRHRHARARNPAHDYHLGLTPALRAIMQQWQTMQRRERCELTREAAECLPEQTANAASRDWSDHTPLQPHSCPALHRTRTACENSLPGYFVIHELPN